MKDILKKEEVDDILQKDIFDMIIIVENNDLKWVKDPDYIASRYLLTNVSYPLKGCNNYRGYYEQILIETGSIGFEHFYIGGESKAPHAPFAFSKAYLNKVIHPSEWGLDPNRKRTLTEYPKMDFSYWDYKDAWYNCFYYNNDAKKHTWFFKISGDFFKKEVPNWIYHWWHRMGAIKKILPDEINNFYKLYEDFNPLFINNNYKELSLFRFFVDYSLPWIWSWQFGIIYQQNYNMGLPTLIRRFYCKWWKKWYSDETFNYMKADIAKWKKKIEENGKMEQAKRDNISLTDPLHDLKDDLKKEYPGISPKDINKKILKILAKQLMWEDQEEHDKDPDNMSISSKNNDDMDIGGTFQNPNNSDDNKDEADEDDSASESSLDIQQILDASDEDDPDQFTQKDNWAKIHDALDKKRKRI